MGDADGIINEGPGPSSTIDSVGGNSLALSGGPFFERVTAPAAASHVGSVYSLLFFNTTYGTASIINGPSDNFGLEFWVNPNSTSGTQCLVYNGNSAYEGWGIYLTNGVYVARFGGNYFGSGTATAGQWTHLALVRTNGTARL
jgi:hypothetical protein